MVAPAELLPLLQTKFGYPTFRPLQGEIMGAYLAGTDVLAVLPTGAGKSLCYQLPALRRPGLTLVVSPLIALMKDQVDQLQALGVAATYLNSSLDAGEARSRLAGLHRGEWRLLYVSPERLMLDGWVENLRAWGVSAIAVDEAHCISEWGHDFRPEYRQLAKLREALAGVPVLALTATATARVRADIVKYLALRAPQVFVASFNRPNLSYRVQPKDDGRKQLKAFVAKREEESGIVYCATRATAEKLAEFLEDEGYSAKPYHAGLEPTERAENQELFLKDEVKIVCATVAFGMGINKPNVRWVVHYDLPKNIEGYYQETGRAGRDGLPGDCLLLFSGGDAAKQQHFIDEIPGAAEQAVARQQLRLMLQFAETASCRRRELLGYFGEEFSLERCDACDNCLEPRETYDGTTVAQKLLSCVFRVRQASERGSGMLHIVEVLVGADTDKIRRWGHEKLSTYGIGTELPRAGWMNVGRELLRLGLLAQTEGEYPVVLLTEAGIETLRSRKPVLLTKPLTTPKVRRVAKVGDGPCDEILLQRLKKLRKQLADERNVPAYVIFGDATLRQMARDYPETPQAMQGIFGMGEKKFEAFAEPFACEIAAYVAENGKVSNLQ
ncbi:DNA helicase RecQ [Nibricoccus sp. IMCC34717]|uniref:DNA helicase RecQ n=1 Tax=Nibricoccus sp. IMCC34717 TaxID=3034021 RepID=UPI00385066F1